MVLAGRTVVLHPPCRETAAYKEVEYEPGDDPRHIVDSARDGNSGRPTKEDGEVDEAEPRASPFVAAEPLKEWAYGPDEEEE